MSEATIPEKSLKVLVIEDDTLTRITLCRVLQKMNCQTVEACNGFMGLTQFRREKPDVVITDILMPDKEGFATIREIRAINPEARIVAMSGGGADKNKDYLQLAEDMGAMHTLKKPFGPAEVGALMQTLRG
jgi:DNA-binding response OmpR family regulator